ncbi:ATP-binding protein [Hymenobacter antarcticus]|uniref:Histidine kinase/HSP90-like ATPase domain-containing protein n=1 Tax=Hymenobacter antarcticus TaxID=486270 RepID=A0ABP7QVW4_9BACT
MLKANLYSVDLSIAREFITTQGGRLWVESEMGSGSTFSFTLPVAGA